MDQESNRAYLQGIFSKIGSEMKGFSTPEKRSNHLFYSGTEKFKKAALGIFGKSTIKSLEGVAELFVQTGITDTLEEAMELVPQVVAASERDCYAIHRNLTEYIQFNEVKDKENNSRYKISVRYGGGD